MRELSLIEKQVVTILCRTGCTFAGIITDHLNEKILIIDREKNSIDVGYKTTDETKKSKGEVFLSVIDLVEDIASILSLLNYLESNFYIFKTKLAPIDPSAQLAGSDENLKLYNSNPEIFRLYRFPDQSIENEIIQNTERFFYATQGLKEYFNNSFKTPEQKRHISNYRLTIIAISISLIIGLSSIILNFYFQNKKAFIDQDQIEHLLFEIDSLRNETMSNYHDTINDPILLLNKN